MGKTVINSKKIEIQKQLIQMKKLSVKTEDSCFNTRNKQVKVNIIIS